MLIFISSKSKLIASCLSDIRVEWSHPVASDARVRLLGEEAWTLFVWISVKCVACEGLFLRLGCFSVPCWDQVSFISVSEVTVVLLSSGIRCLW